MVRSAVLLISDSYGRSHLLHNAPRGDRYAGRGFSRLDNLVPQPLVRVGLEQRADRASDVFGGR